MYEIGGVGKLLVRSVVGKVEAGVGGSEVMLAGVESGDFLFCGNPESHKLFEKTERQRDCCGDPCGVGHEP